MDWACGSVASIPSATKNENEKGVKLIETE